MLKGVTLYYFMLYSNRIPIKKSQLLNMGNYREKSLNIGLRQEVSENQIKEGGKKEILFRLLVFLRGNNCIVIHIF